MKFAYQMWGLCIMHRRRHVAKDTSWSGFVLVVHCRTAITYALSQFPISISTLHGELYNPSITSIIETSSICHVWTNCYSWKQKKKWIWILIRLLPNLTNCNLNHLREMISPFRINDTFLPPTAIPKTPNSRKMKTHFRHWCHTFTVLYLLALAPQRH